MYWILGRNCHSFFSISTSKLTVIMRTLDLPRFYYGRRRFRAFELLLSCDLNWFPVSPSASLFCHICGRANSMWAYYSTVIHYYVICIHICILYNMHIFKNVRISSLVGFILVIVIVEFCDNIQYE